MIFKTRYSLLGPLALVVTAWDPQVCLEHPEWADYLLAGPVPNRQALIDVPIGQPWLDWMKAELFDLEDAKT